MSWVGRLGSGISSAIGGASAGFGIGGVPGAIVGGGLGLVSGVAGSSDDAAEAARNRAWQSEENQKGRDWQSNENLLSRDFNSAEAQKNRDYQTSEREAQNAWNSPEQQMQRLSAAGINPWLAMGGSQASGTSSMMGSGSSASSSPGSSGFSGSPSTMYPSQSDANRAQSVAALAQAAKAVGDTVNARELLSTEIDLNVAKTMNERSQAAVNQMNAFNIPAKVQAEIFRDMSEGIKNGKSVAVMDADIKEKLAKAGLDDAQQFFVQMSLAPLNEAMASYYKSLKTTEDELREPRKENINADTGQKNASANNLNVQSYDTLATLDARIEQLRSSAAFNNASAGEKKLMNSLLYLDWKALSEDGGRQYIYNIQKELDNTAVYNDKYKETLQSQLDLLKANVELAKKTGDWYIVNSIVGNIRDLAVGGAMLYSTRGKGFSKMAPIGFTVGR